MGSSRWQHTSHDMNLLSKTRDENFCPPHCNLRVEKELD